MLKLIAIISIFLVVFLIAHFTTGLIISVYRWRKHSYKGLKQQIQYTFTNLI
jgi:membrane protein YdbS with pleckstrin-like domain